MASNQPTFAQDTLMREMLRTNALVQLRDGRVSISRRTVHSHVFNGLTHRGWLVKAKEEDGVAYYGLSEKAVAHYEKLRKEANG